MNRLRVHNLSMSLDGYVAGPDQSIDAPLGVGGMALHDWVFQTRTGADWVGADGGAEGIDDAFIRRGDEGIGATIIGRNMFGPVRGPWGDESWRGWWGETPPYHHEVFVLTHHERPSLEMHGGTTFHFVTGGIELALTEATAAAGDLDVRLGGGASSVQQFLRAGLVDELHIAVVPILLGRGERLFDHLGDTPLGYEAVEVSASQAVVHVRLARTP